MPEYLAPGVYIEEISFRHAGQNLDDLYVSHATLSGLKLLRETLLQRKASENDDTLYHGIDKKGLCALFSGPAGKGKTQSAKMLAYDLGYNLYRVELSSVISKYIGETEKNLSKVFEQAESSNAILFFDEADALFGKRTDIKDAHDRYANLETSYLLQRIESFEGVVILATNTSDHIDDAFMRRIRFIIEFSFPNANEREPIWQRVFNSLKQKYRRRKSG